MMTTKIPKTDKLVDNELKTNQLIEPFWCAVANIKKENLFGEEHIVRKGTKHFRGGAKVYIADAYWGMCESVTVIGHHRSNSRFVKMDIHIKKLENIRLELVYSPKVAELINRNFDEKYIGTEGYTKEYAERIIETVPLWIDDYQNRNYDSKNSEK